MSEGAREDGPCAPGQAPDGAERWFRGDQCVAHWGVMDMAGALAQMGAMPHA